MTVELITGHAGAAHISSADAGWFNAGAFGSGKYVLDTGAKLAATVQSANLVTIGVGDALFEGRHVRVSATENVAIDNGAQNLGRHDIICLKYEYDTSLDVESASIVVVKGTAAASPADPTIPSGSILDGATEAYMPLWRIVLDGIAVGTPEKLFTDALPLIDSTVEKLPISRGGTNATTAAAARTNLGVPSFSTSNGWQITRWPNGYTTVCKAVSATVDVSSQWVNLYYGAFPSVTLPMTFNTSSIHEYSVTISDGSMWTIATIPMNQTTVNAITGIYAVSAGAVGSRNVTAFIRVGGYVS